ncbi:MAG: hypothetical protein JWO83_3056 [Caulobacteraceae bacterium]|jgi:hypothetical protein|nr:hypothetical protein [Caulobacteraceae bacterium]
MSLSRIVMRLARNPRTEFAEGDDHRGYTLTAPLTPDRRLDVEAWRKHRDRCVVRRFAPDEDPVEGRLARRGESWFFDYQDEEGEADEAVYRLGDHTFAAGDYVTITDGDGRPLTYKVTEVIPV